MHLQYLDTSWLISRAGGDPWAINKTLQSGSPAEISGLAQAFHDAGQSTGHADDAFNDALRRFNAAWNRETGDHPINDAAEVQRATQSLGVQAAQLPKIALDLELLAVSLAEAQHAAGEHISCFEGNLEEIDLELADMHAEQPTDLIFVMAQEDIIHALREEAVAATTHCLQRVERTRDEYSHRLHDAMARLRVNDGYDASFLWSVDGYEETPDQAEKDVHAALSGDDEAARRINAVLASITGDQLAGKAPLSAEQGSVLSQLQAQQHGMSVDALVAAEGRLGDQRRMIADSWQLMSNPAIVFPRTELKPGAKQGTDTVKGAAAQLPDGVQQVLNVGGLLANLGPIAGVIKNGNAALQSNTELDRGLMRKASAMMNSGFWVNIDPASHGLHADRDTAFDLQIADALSAVSPDHQVVHAFLTGPDRESLLRNITHHFWAGKGIGVDSLFSWTEGAAHGPEARIAAETARVYSTYIGSHETELLHLPGNNTVGQANPDLIRGMARGLKPYIGNIADVAGAQADFGNPPDRRDDIDSGRMPIAKGIFSVLSTDQTAREDFNGAADRQALTAEGAYAQAVVNHTPHMSSYNANLHDAATLRGLVRSGIHSAVQADVENHHLSQTEAETAEYDRMRSVYESSLKFASGTAGLIPTVGAYAGPSIGILGSALESDFIGKPPTASPMPTDHPLPNMSVGQADREILNALIASGQHVDGIPQYLIGGHVADPEDLPPTQGVRSGVYDHDLSEALAQIFAKNYGNDPGRPVIPDRDMVDRYNAVTLDPNPLKR